MPDSLTRIVFVLIPQLELLDIAGPAQVFETAARESGCDWRLFYFGEQDKISTSQGITLAADTQWPQLTKNDIIVIPGWRMRANTVTSGLTKTTLDRIAEHTHNGGTVMSVCSGAFALAQAGLLKGRKATTHHRLQKLLGHRFPQVKVVRDVLFVTDGTVHTSAGIASGIDLALHLVACRLGSKIAADVARRMVVYVRRNGDDLQESVLLRHRNHVDELVHNVQDTIEQQFDQPLPLSVLAQRHNVSKRTLTRAFQRTLGLTPLQYQQQLRLEYAEQLIAAGSTIEAAALRVGFNDARMLRTLRLRNR